jgi:hypothetical protein
MAFIGEHVGSISDFYYFGKTASTYSQRLYFKVNFYYDKDTNRVGIVPYVEHERKSTSSSWDILPLDEHGTIEVDGVAVDYPSKSGGSTVTGITYVYYLSNTVNEGFLPWYDDEYGNGFPLKQTYTITWTHGSIYSNTYTFDFDSNSITDVTKDSAFYINSIPGFTDLDNPAIYYSVNDKNLVSKLEAAISLDGETADVAYREVSIDDGYYQFNLTEAERDVLRAAAENSYTISVYFLLKASFPFSQEGKVKSKVTTMTVQGAEPGVTMTVTDTNTKTVALTGDSSKLIRYHSVAQVNVDAVADAGATIETVTITHAGQTVVGNKATFENVQNGKFAYRVTDSRDNVVSDSTLVAIYDYTKLTIQLTEKIPPDAETGDMSFTVKGNFWHESFKTAANTLTIQYRYKLATADDFSSWTAVSSSNIKYDSNNSHNYTATGTIPGLDYTKTYQLQVRAVDKLETATTEIARMVKTPIFDWSATDFNINVPTTIDGMEYGKNIVLWQGNGGSQMTSGHTAYLNQPLQLLPHGIVLVFSSADGDVSWSTHFVPKSMISINQGGAQCFMMANNAGLGVFGAKYLYIYDDMIQGHTSNNQSGTAASGIKFNNAAFVLRAVLGV